MLKNFIQKQDGQYGKIDNLNITLDGNRVVGVEDDAAPLLYKGALDFTVSTERDTEYTYDGDGRLTGDMNRSIAKIDYDAAGNPRRVQYMDGSVTRRRREAARRPPHRCSERQRCLRPDKGIDCKRNVKR